MNKRYRSRDDHNFFETVRSLPTVKDKLEFIWSYYHLLIIGIIAVIAVGISLGFSIYKNSAPVYLNGAYVNVYRNESQPDYREDYLESAFLQDFLGFDPDDRTKMEYVVNVPINTNADNMMADFSNSQSNNILDVRMAAHEIDYFICTPDIVNVIDYRFDSQFDFRSFLTDEELERYKDRLVYSLSGIPTAIDITGSDFIKYMGLTGGKPVCLSLISYSGRTEHFRPFFDFIMSSCK